MAMPFGGSRSPSPQGQVMFRGTGSSSPSGPPRAIYPPGVPPGVVLSDIQQRYTGSRSASPAAGQMMVRSGSPSSSSRSASSLVARTSHGTGSPSPARRMTAHPLGSPRNPPPVPFDAGIVPPPPIQLDAGMAEVLRTLPEAERGDFLRDTLQQQRQQQSETFHSVLQHQSAYMAHAATVHANIHSQENMYSALGYSIVRTIHCMYFLLVFSAFCLPLNTSMLLLF